MSTVYHASVFLHVLAAVVWLGGMIAFALLAPVLRRLPDEAERQRVFHRLGERFRVVGWACLLVLLLTGLHQTGARGWLSPDILGAAAFWASPVGTAFAAKLLTVAAMIVVQALHDFRLGPGAGRVEAGTPQAQTLRRRAALLARLNAALAPILLWFAVAVARGG